MLLLDCLNRNTTGPDGLKACLLKDRPSELKGVFERLFHSILNTRTVPKIMEIFYNQACAKKARCKYSMPVRPITITILSKTMKRALASHLTITVVTNLDPYKSDRGTGHAVLTLPNAVMKQLMHPKGYARFLFVGLAQLLIQRKYMFF